MDRRDTLRAMAAGKAAVAVQPAAEVLFQVGGRKILAEGVQHELRRLTTEHAALAIGRFAPALLDTPGALEKVARRLGPARGILRSAGVQSARQLARAATREVLRGAGRAAGMGLVCDGAFGLAEGIAGHRRGEMTTRQACVHVAREAGTGAAAGFVGVLLSAGLVAVTGGAAAPVVFAVGAGGALLAKAGLTRLWSRSTPSSRRG